MPFTTAPDGVELYYEVEGEGFPLVFTHGNLGSGHKFFLQTRILSRKYKCIVHDLRGCGLSGKPQAEVYDTKTLASDLHSILTQLGVGKAVHLGHSFGGPISLQYYFDYPDEIAGLVFIASYASGKDIQKTGRTSEEYRLRVYETLQGRRDTFLGVSISEKFIKYNPYAAPVVEMIWKEGTKPPMHAAQATVKGYFRLDFTDRLPEVKVPALILCGDSDIATSYETCGKVLQQGIPDSRVEIVKDGAHDFFLEKPEIVNEAIWDWLEEKTKQ